jgi:hypothetical protein
MLLPDQHAYCKSFPQDDYRLTDSNLTAKQAKKEARSIHFGHHPEAFPVFNQSSAFASSVLARSIAVIFRFCPRPRLVGNQQLGLRPRLLF